MINGDPHTLDLVRVGDCMRATIFSCDGNTSVRDLAAAMSSLRVHALAVQSEPLEAPYLVSDLDVMAGIVVSEHFTARDLAGPRPVTVSRAQPLREAAQLMVERSAAHAIVLDEANGHAVGVLSTSDILQAYAGATAGDHELAPDPKE